MTWEAIVTLFVLISVVTFFAATSVRPDIIIWLGLAILGGCQILSVREIVAGLLHPGVWTIGCLLLVAAGLRETGSLRWLASHLLGRPRSLFGAYLRLLLPVGAMSAFLNNTPVVAILASSVKEWGQRIGINPLQLLIPLSYAAILGGLCTLVGTSTNLVVHSLWLQSGKAPMGLFEITKIGLPCALIGLGYMLWVGRYLLPRPFSSPQGECTPTSESPQVRLQTAGRRMASGMARIAHKAEVQALSEWQLPSQGGQPSSPVAMCCPGPMGADCTLPSSPVFVPAETHAEVQLPSTLFRFLHYTGPSAVPQQGTTEGKPARKALWALSLLGVMMLVAALGWLSMLEASAIAAGLMLLTGCFSLRSAAKSIPWPILGVIAGSFGIGLAMQKTGLAGFIAKYLLLMTGKEPYLALLAFFVLTTILTECMTNNAVAVFMFPVALSTASRLDVSAMPFLMTLMIAASSSFITPLGYQTNLIVYKVGGYRFFDFVRIGLPLNLLLAVTTMIGIPLIWPF